MDFDKLRRSDLYRGRTTIRRQVSTIQRERNDYLAGLLDQGLSLSGEYGREPTTGKAYFVFGESSATDLFFI